VREGCSWGIGPLDSWRSWAIGSGPCGTRRRCGGEPCAAAANALL